MFQQTESPKIKTDLELSRIDRSASEQVAAHLKGFASSSSSRSSTDSQYPVGVRLETGHQARAMVASCASPVGGQGGALPENSSSSSSSSPFNPAPKHTALVEHL